jgi:hypothetical protein
MALARGSWSRRLPGGLAVSHLPRPHKPAQFKSWQLLCKTFLLPSMGSLKTEQRRASFDIHKPCPKPSFNTRKLFDPIWRSPCSTQRSEECPLVRYFPFGKSLLIYWRPCPLAVKFPTAV